MRNENASIIPRPEDARLRRVIGVMQKQFPDEEIPSDPNPDRPPLTETKATYRASFALRPPTGRPPMVPCEGGMHHRSRESQWWTLFGFDVMARPVCAACREALKAHVALLEANPGRAGAPFYVEREIDPENPERSHGEIITEAVRRDNPRLPL